LLRLNKPFKNLLFNNFYTNFMDCFIYARKSTESEDRQVLSIEAQIKELQAVALNQGIKIVEVFSEAKSAKAPGRPIFNKVIERMYQSKEMGILCWKLDRLARNPVDGGQLIWSIEQGRIKQIVTPHRRFLNSGDDKFWMQLEFGMAKKYIDDLSDNVKRGNRAKLEKGILPGKAPIGYLNDKESRLIVKDPDRFPLIRRIWDMVLRGEYSILDILRIAEEDWGLKTRQTKKEGGKPLTKSLIYKLLSNPFYYGAILRKGEIYPGCHEPMVTKDEFDKVQKILGRPTTKPNKKEFAYTGLIKCGECGSMVTAEEQVNRYGYHYTYYHCSKKKGGIHNHCGQKYVRVEELENQIASYLESILLPESFVAWGITQLKLAQTEEEKLQGDIHRSLENAVADCKRKLDNLLNLKLKDLLTDQEFVEQKSELTAKRMQLEGRLSMLESNSQIWFEPSEKLFLFLTLAKDCFLCGDRELKREILETVSSNLWLSDRKLLIEAKKPFVLAVQRAQSPPGWGLVDDVRTFFADPSRHFHIPVLKSAHLSPYEK